MSFLTNMQSVANRLLTDKGESITFSRETSSGFNPVTGIDAVTTSTFSGYAHPSPYKLGEIDGTIIQSDDIQLLVESLDTTPAQGDGCLFRAEDYRVMMVRPISVQGGDAAYKVQIRK